MVIKRNDYVLYYFTIVARLSTMNEMNLPIRCQDYDCRAQKKTRTSDYWARLLGCVFRLK